VKFSIKFIVLSFIVTLISKEAAAQNVLINILTKNAGIVQKGHNTFIEVTINNTDPTSFIGIYKLKAQISVPNSIVNITASGHSLPTGWEIISNSDSTITLSNGKDIIASNDARTLLIAIKGKKIGGPLSVAGQISFSNGSAPGTEPGSLKGDNPADNFATSSCQVKK